ncbi:hypothetical protein DEU56DRAFT_939145 [Suillus clintonianus]|uniref:uncharacterized protein n=1 Tax=Suillus clintonianus TaxID=1904413 RepID=UPI001B883286|nr:uncharacterized protein DEU56DRAFT_939145 [Suillus clintonianus]KAG2142991.1 hypothetical protein DEU56DRAFT_939145 [Suillus clintonianus]
MPMQDGPTRSNSIRTLKTAGPLGLGICVVLCLLANIAYFSAATKAEIDKSGVTVTALFFGNIFGSVAEHVLSVFINVITVPLAVAPRPQPQQESQLHGQTQASSSQTQHTTTSTSTTPPASGTDTTAANEAVNRTRG